MLSKSHKRVPEISERVPQERKILLEQYTMKAQEEVDQLDSVIAGLIKQTKRGKENEVKQSR